MTQYLNEVYFYVKIQLCVTATLTRIQSRTGLAPFIRIRTAVKSWIRVRIETNADAQH
jgi:hypothetical protein